MERTIFVRGAKGRAKDIRSFFLDKFNTMTKATTKALEDDKLLYFYFDEVIHCVNHSSLVGRLLIANCEEMVLPNNQ